MKAGRELRQQRTQASTDGERFDAAFELIDVRARDGAGIVRHQWVSELLIELDREVEMHGRALDPAERGRGARWTVERTVDFDGVEALRIETELVQAATPMRGEAIENAVPRAPADRVIPTRRADSQLHGSTLPRVAVSRFAIRFSPRQIPFELRTGNSEMRNAKCE